MATRFPTLLIIANGADFLPALIVFYDNNPANAETYGNLYNWYTVDDPRGLAPEGWHIATDNEIKELEMHLGMSESEANNTEWRGTNEGSKLAGNAILWNDGALVNDPVFSSSGLTSFRADIATQ